jgi:hypothetical protein
VVHPAQFVSGGAHVSSVWTEKFLDDNNQPAEVNYEIVWLLRQEAAGWRLAGMATELVPGHGMQVLNFEDPDEMIRKRDEAIAAMQPPAAETAQQPQTTIGQPQGSVER